MPTFTVNTTSAIVGGNMIREDLILEAIDRHDAKDLAEATLIAEGRTVILTVLPILTNANTDRMVREAKRRTVEGV